MIDPDFKAKWVAALRSGDYTQGHDRLKNKDAFCCLGVALDIQHWTWDRCERAVLNDEVIGALDIPDSKYLCGLSRNLAQNLIHRNDGCGLFEDNAQTFDQIADYIETL